jgi:hypothetical protein
MMNRKAFIAAILALPSAALVRARTGEAKAIPGTLKSLDVVARVRATDDPLCVYVGRRGPEELIAAREVVTFRGNWRRIYRWDGGIESYSPTAHVEIVALDAGRPSHEALLANG